MPASVETQKAFGAYYTPQRVADFLTNWAIRSSSDVVLDPSAGAGVFLLAAARRFKALDDTKSPQIIGIELSSATVEQSRNVLAEQSVVAKLICKDFFECSVADTGLVDALIGNPPFIRFHRFAGSIRERALKRAREAGVQISALTSSWAPFLVHATTFVAPAGRMAVVAPGELAHAAYAQPLVKHLCDSFSHVRLLVFRKRLFPDLSEDTVLVLAENKGKPFEGLSLHSLDDADSLRPVLDSGIQLERSNAAAPITRIAEHFLPRATRDLYRELSKHSKVTRLGDLADVGIGYVTGNNDYFHLTAAKAAEFKIPGKYLAPAIRRMSDSPGLFFRTSDWQMLRDRGAANLLLRARGSDIEDLDDGLKRYIRRGVTKGVPKGYKCRNRRPWFVVPHVHKADAFLSYMSGHHPRLVVNAARAYAPNTLHVVRLTNSSPELPAQIAVGWKSALVELSCEVEGHSLGGGLLKLEPGEAEHVTIPLLKGGPRIAEELDVLARGLFAAESISLLDEALASDLGISCADVRKLRDGAAVLRERRTTR